MNRDRRHSSRRHRAHGQIRAEHRVAAGEHAGQVCGERAFIGGDAPRGHGQSFALGQRSFHRLSRGGDHRGALDGEIGVLRSPPAGGVRMRRVRRASCAGRSAGQSLSGPSFQTHRRHEQVDVHAFGFGGLHFFHERRASPAGCGDRARARCARPAAPPSGRSPWRYCRRRSPQHHGPIPPARLGHLFQKLDPRRARVARLRSAALSALRPDGQEDGVVPRAQFGRG
jgi:hypothetical protein